MDLRRILLSLSANDTTHRTFSIYFPNLPPTLLLFLIIKAMNYTPGTELQVPYALIYDELPQIFFIRDYIIPHPDLGVHAT